MKSSWVTPKWLQHPVRTRMRCLQMQQMQKTITFATEMQKNDFLAVSGAFNVYPMGWGAPKCRKCRKITFAAKMQKSDSLTKAQCTQCLSHGLWCPKCRECRKGLPLQQKSIKVIPWLRPNAFNVYPMGWGAPECRKCYCPYGNAYDIYIYIYWPLLALLYCHCPYGNANISYIIYYWNIWDIKSSI